MDFKRISLILLGVMLISFGIGFYSLYYIDNFRLDDYLVGNSIIISEKDNLVKIDSEGIRVKDGDTFVSISWRGIVVEDGDTKTTIGINSLDELFRNINIGSSGTTYTEDLKKEFSAEGIEELKIDTIFVDTYIYKGEDEKISIVLNGKYASNKKFEFDYRVVGNTLQITNTPNTGSITVANSNLKLELYIPDNIIKNIQFESSSGDLKVNDIYADKIKFESSSGSFISNNTITSSFNIKSSSGNVTIKPHSGSADINSSSGDVTLSLTNESEKIKINSSSGNINILNIKEYMGNISARTSSGRVVYEGSSVPGNNLEVTSLTSTYLIQMSTSSGNINIE